MILPPVEMEKTTVVAEVREEVVVVRWEGDQEEDQQVRKTNRNHPLLSRETAQTHSDPM
jgi:hypothetical protein